MIAELCCIAVVLSQSQRPPVIYEANLRAFGKNGGLAELRARVPRLRSLGVDAIWLMPVFPVGKVRSAGGLGSPYAVQDYSRLSEEYGTPNDLHALVRDAHKLGVRIILDWVANHTSWDNPWLAHKGWYTQNDRGEIIIPPGTNWQDAAELNYDNPDMRRAMIAAMQGWINRFDVDGFRCDAADFVPTDFWREAITGLRASTRKPLLFLAEGSKKEQLEAGFDLQYGWDTYYNLRAVYNEGRSAKTVVPVARKEDGDLPPGRARLRYTANHDEAAWTDSSIHIFGGKAGAMAAFTVTSLLGGATLIYTGQDSAYAEKIPFFDRSDAGLSQDPMTSTAIAQILKIRRESAEKNHVEDWSSEGVVAYNRGRLSVIANIRREAQEMAIPKDRQGRRRDLLDGKTLELGDRLRLAPFQRLVLVPL